MSPAASVLIGVAVLGGLIVGARPARAQSEVSALLSARLGDVRPGVDYRAGALADRPVHGRGGELGITRHDLSVVFPVAADAHDEWTVTLRGRLDQVDTSAPLPDTGERFPDDLWDLRAGLTYRRRLEGGWLGAVSVTGGSASDVPFASVEEVIGSATALVRIPDGPTDAWVAGLTWSSNRAFLNYVPLPLLGYWYQPRPDRLLFAGLPFLILRLGFADRVTLLATYFPPERGNAQLLYDVLPRRLALYARIETDEVRYLRADRQRSADALTFLERRAGLGARLALSPRHSLEVSGGYAFDKLLYEGEDFGERGRNRLNVGDGPYAAAHLSVRF